MNPSVFISIVIAVIAVGFYIFTLTPKGKKWIKNL